MKIKSINILSIAFVFTLFACSTNEGESTEETVAEVSEAEVAESVKSEVDDVLHYSVPTPNELFAVVKNANAEYNKDILNNVENTANYNSKSAQALNFGVYAADLAYVSSLGHIEDASPIFETMRTLSKSLEIENAIDKAIYERFQSNLDASNPDSLFYLSNETYYNAYSYLEENQRGDVLGMIIIGGWIEGLHIILNIAPYEEGSEIVERIADQKLTLENLLVFTSRIQNEELDRVIGELAVVDEVFSALENGEEADLTTEFNGEGEDKVAVFGGGSSTSITNEQFDELKTIVGELRASIIEGSL